MGMENVVLADGKLKGRTAIGDIAIPLQSVGFLLRPASHEKAMDVEALVARLGLKRGDQDVLVVAAGGGQAVAVSGILLRMAGGQVVIEYDGTESPMPADSVRLIQMAKAAGTTSPAAPVATLVCFDGSTVAIESMSADGGGWQIRSPSLGAMKVAKESVSGVRFRTGQVTMLSEMTPTVRQSGFFDETFAWKKNRAVSGGPLQVGGRTYENGIGVHARCTLTYTLGGAYRSFSAVAGIDESVRAGSAMFSIEADGKALLAPVRLESGKTPHQVRAEVKGVEKLTVLVDFADGTFGNGARVDLCDAVLAK